MDAIEAAHTVFGLFQRRYVEAMGGSRTWALRFDYQDDDVPGLTGSEARMGVNVLLQKDLIKPMAIGSFCLTPEGEEACLHPELLDDYLAPRSPFVSAQQVNISGGNVQIGDGNTQRITYGALLRGALQVAEEREDVPAPVAAALRRLYEYPDIEGLMAQAAERLGK